MSKRQANSPLQLRIHRPSYFYKIDYISIDRCFNRPHSSTEQISEEAGRGVPGGGQRLPSLPPSPPQPVKRAGATGAGLAVQLIRHGVLRSVCFGHGGRRIAVRGCRAITVAIIKRLGTCTTYQCSRLQNTLF